MKKVKYKEQIILVNNPLYQAIGEDLNLGKLSSIDMIQPLWGGYGELVRLTFSDKSIIVKHVKLPKPSAHPRGWNSDHSHQRKLHSYQVEVNWYQNFSSSKDDRCRIPQGFKCFQTENEWLIVMEDLAEAGFANTTMSANKNHLKTSLDWLANFHARYMQVRSPLIWETGTYWHLETRFDELKVLEESELKNFAQRIDEELKETTHQTIVHGDAKLANFCFNADASHCAAVDFQYVGHGCGMKDVAYFMSSAVEPEECEQMEEWILDTYFIALEEAIKHYQPHLESDEIEREWRPLFAVAWADFQRFIKGWSPDHYKINPYSESLTTKALEYLKSKKENVVLLGIGNVLQKDDGIGVYAAEYLTHNYTFSPKLHIINGGVEGINLLNIFIENNEIIILDTISLDDTAGAIYNIPTQELGGYGLNSGSAHEIGVLQCLDMLDLQDIPKPTSNIIAIVPEEISFAFSLSDALKQNFDNYIKVILADLLKKGFHATKHDTTTPLEEIIRKFEDPSYLKA